MRGGEERKRRKGLSESKHEKSRGRAARKTKRKIQAYTKKKSENEE